MPKSKVKFRLRCSGKGKPWHQTRTHTYTTPSLQKGIEAVVRWNVEARTPGALECLPMIVETRIEPAWLPVEEGTQETP